MTKLTILTALALALGVGAAVGDPCGSGNCATDEPIVTTVPQGDCPTSGCATFPTH
jgi:hypothetical protein